LYQKEKRFQKKNPNEQNDQQNITITTINPVIREEKKKQQVDKQTNIYANLFGGGRIPRLSSTTQTKKPNSTVVNSTSLSASVSLLDENSTNHQS